MTTHFPASKTVLWDRTALQTSRYIKPSQVIPALHLSPSDISTLLTTLEAVVEDCIYPTITFSLHIQSSDDVLIGSAYSRSKTKEEEDRLHQRGSSSSSFSSKYVFTIVNELENGEEGGTSRKLAVPVELDSTSVSEGVDLSFESLQTT
jgi:hypothetical protein